MDLLIESGVMTPHLVRAGLKDSLHGDSGTQSEHTEASDNQNDASYESHTHSDSQATEELPVDLLQWNRESDGDGSIPNMVGFVDSFSSETQSELDLSSSNLAHDIVLENNYPPDILLGHHHHAPVYRDLGDNYIPFHFRQR